jgi:hypothetical protein
LGILAPQKKKFVNRKSKICSKPAILALFKKVFQITNKNRKLHAHGVRFYTVYWQILNKHKNFRPTSNLHVRQPASFHGFLCQLKKKL